LCELARVRTAYLHGFGSGPESRKGRALAGAFEAVDAGLERLDLNRPSFEVLTISAALAEIERWYADAGDDARAAGPIDAIGSSLGGYLAALWAERHPERVRRLVLLCPGLDMVHRWPTLFGPQAMARWERDGALRLPDARGVFKPIHWGFIEDARNHPPVPRPRCPTLVIHGRDDAVVPIESSRAWVPTLADGRLIEVDDGHDLTASIELINSETLAFLRAE
jgi:pimeloyl-ACP methyl ester carboxylesterase